MKENKDQKINYSFRNIVIIQVVVCVVVIIFAVSFRYAVNVGAREVQIYYADMMENSVTGQKITEWTQKANLWISEAREIYEEQKEKPLTLEEWIEKIKKIIKENSNGT